MNENREEPTWSWEKVLWEELDALPGPQRVVAAGEIIARMSHVVLVDLGRYRRMSAVEEIDSGRHTHESLADSIGSRLPAVRRLVEEGRTIRRIEEREREALVDPPPPGVRFAA